MTDEGKLRGAPIATSGASDEEPAWNAKGDLIAYVQRNPADNTSRSGSSTRPSPRRPGS